MANPVKFEPFTNIGAPTAKPAPPAQPSPAPPPSTPPPSFTPPPSAQPGFTAPARPLDFRTSDPTRYLSAGAYLSRAVRDMVFTHVINEKHRAIIASYGVDLATVAGHCLLARRRKMARDGLICGLAILFLGSLFLGVPLVTPLILLGAWGVVVFDSYNTKFNILGARFGKKSFDPDRIQNQLKPSDKTKLAEIAALQKGNVVVYGGFSPFVGSGIEVGGWSFTTKVNKGKEEHGKRLTPMPVRPEEMHQALTRAIYDLGLDSVSVEDKLYVDGEEIRDDRTFLSHPLGRPYSTVDPATVRNFIANSTPAVRHYKCIQTISWKAELVLSIFVRFTKVKNNLFAEASYFLLTPLLEFYHQIDNLRPTPKFREVVDLLIQSAIKAPFMFLYSPAVTLFNLLSPFIEWWAEKDARKAIEEKPAFNYGAVTSIRERVTSDSYRRYFQKLDKEMHVKIIERQILDCITEFLESKNVDTSESNERKERIINYGVIVSGGSVQAQSIAAGNQAMAQVNKLANAIGLPGVGKVAFSPLNVKQNPGHSKTKG
jgi:hypothetical protein